MTSEIIHFRDFLIDYFRVVEKITKVDESERFPEGLKYSFNLMIFKDKWVTLARIDNHVHRANKFGPHLHRIDREEVDYSVDLKPEDITEYLLELATQIIGDLKW
jgi:hypothetical protein